MSMRKKYLLLSMVLVLALTVTGALALAGWNQAQGQKARLHEIYQGALLSALRQMEDMQLSLEKALLTGSSAHCAAYLSQVSSGGAQVQRSLSLLPLSHPANQPAVKFANQLSDYADSLIAKGNISSRDYEQLKNLITICREYTQALSGGLDRLSAAALSGAPFYPEGEMEESYDSAVSYPSLIYDGPFSDGRKPGAAQALAGLPAITREDAERIAREFVGPERVVRTARGADMGGPIPCYGVTLELNDITLEAAVTCQGGKILWLTPDHADFPLEKTMEDCRAAALEFLSARGYEHMQPTYFQVYQGIGVISFAATQGETILYPDLIKLQLRMDNAQVVGMEARNYWQNHVPRGLLQPDLTPDEARALVSNPLQIEKMQLCLIPTEAGERLCYEFRGTFQDDIYLLYIDAQTGEEADLLKLVEGSTGLEAV